MQLKRFNPETTPFTRKGKACIRFSEHGAISLSKEALKIIDYKKGDGIEILQDEKSPKDWYILKSKEGFETRTKGDIDSVIFNSAATTRALFDSIKFLGKSFAFLIAKEPIKFQGKTIYAIITATYKPEEKE